MMRSAGSWLGEDVYQNARYEDLRPVSRPYIHNCHLRVMRHLKPEGRFLLDAGSGPVQYPEYLEYSRDYDLPGLRGYLDHRLERSTPTAWVIVACMWSPISPTCRFKPGMLSMVSVSLHTIHHLPEEEHLDAYQELLSRPRARLHQPWW